MDRNPFAPPAATVADAPTSRIEIPPTPFFAVSTAKLFVLSVCTMGLYQIYWFLKNWQLIKAREGSKISPAPRAVFSVLFCYPCFARIRDFSTPAVAKSALAAGPLSIGWVITSLLHKLPDPYWLVSIFAVVFLIPVQAHANRVNSAVSPNHDPNARFGLWNWFAVGVGSLLVLLATVGSFVPGH